MPGAGLTDARTRGRVVASRTPKPLLPRAQHELIRLAPLAGFLALSGIVAAAILFLCAGHLVYSLDDPYIHMALARNLWAGHYGLNLAEVSAPSAPGAPLMTMLATFW